MPYRINIQPGNLSLVVESHETILEAALAQGFRFPYGCDAGSCEVCSGTLTSGSLHLKTKDIDVFAGDDNSDDVLFCLAQPTSDCTIIMEGVLAPGELPMIAVSCQVVEVTPYASDTSEITLRLPAGKKITFHPGQYLMVILDEETHCAFSIGNTPNEERLIKLYVGFANKDKNALRLRSRFVAGNMVKISLPHGNCYLENPTSTAPLYLVAGSTGISQIKSITEQCIAENHPRQVFIYWGTRSSDELFLHDYFLQVASTHPNIQYTAVVSESDKQWQGRTGLVHQAMLDDGHDLTGAEIMLCGSPPMVYAVLDDLLAIGVQKHQVNSDVFDYAPRD
ncbi:MAG: hypothetical protein COA99_07995 [Moraxellaceae bacterium]|nr:MAG: hypothetical protein COA99_07995 [Moraxellaceae bacterium]